MKRLGPLRRKLNIAENQVLDLTERLKRSAIAGVEALKRTENADAMVAVLADKLHAATLLAAKWEAEAEATLKQAVAIQTERDALRAALLSTARQRHKIRHDYGDGDCARSDFDTCINGTCEEARALGRPL